MYFYFEYAGGPDVVVNEKTLCTKVSNASSEGERFTDELLTNEYV
jgi:hypothetical protein